MSAAVGRLTVYLRLGRVSNLPTVWSNVLAGVVLAGSTVELRGLAVLLLALTLFYVAGMFLNDAFDRQVDARERPERPIPSGLVGVGEVLLLGTGLLGAGVALVLLGARLAGSCESLTPLWSALGLAGAIVLYDVWHKGNPLSPLLMGACRMLVYITAAATVTGGVDPPVIQGAGLLLCYLIGLTYAAKQENLAQLTRRWPLLFLAVPLLACAPVALRSPSTALCLAALLALVVYAVKLLLQRPPRVPRSVMHFIAGISLLDALLVAASGRPGLAALAALGFPATLLLQRYVRGT